MINGDKFDGWSVTANYDVIKIKDKWSWKMNIKLTGKEAMKLKEVYDVKFIFGTQETTGLELFKCGQDKIKESSRGGVFSKQFTSKLNYPQAFSAKKQVADFKVNMNWKALERPNVEKQTLSCTAARVLDGPNIPLKINQPGV